MKSNLPMLALLFGSGVMAGILLESRVFNHGGVAEPARQVAANVRVPEDLASNKPTRERLPAKGPSRLKPAVPPAKIEDEVLATPGKAGKLVIEEPIYKFGERESGDVVKHTFVLRNDGPEPLLVHKVLPGCGCTLAQLSTKEIAPGQKAELAVQLNLALQKGPQNREIVVKTSDPSQGVSKLALVGVAVPRVTLTPDRVNVGDVAATSPASSTIKVTAEKGLKFNVLETRTSGETVTADVKVIKPGTDFEVTVKLNPPLQAGDFHGWVHLLTDDKGEYRVIGIPVGAHVVGVGAESGPPAATEKPSSRATSRRSHAVEVGEVFEFAGTTADAQQVSAADFKGKPVVIAFWATWCGACKQHIPELIKLREKYHARGLDVVGISMDSKKESLQKYVAEKKIPWKNIFFEASGTRPDNPLARRYKVQGIPCFVLLDRAGRVVTADARGPALEKAVASLLDKDAAAIQSAALQTN